MPSSIINKTSRQKINKGIKELNNIINKLDLRRFTEHSTQPQTKYTFFPSAPKTFTEIDYILGYKKILNEFEKTEII